MAHTYTLHVLGGDLDGQSIVVDHDLVVGRSTTCDLFVPDRRMSRLHARIFLDGGRLFVEDLESHNGTFVNGKRVTREALYPADIVRIGGSQFEVALVAQAPPAVDPTRAPSSPHFIKPMANLTLPDLGTMQADAYFDAIGAGDTGSRRVRTQDEIDFLVKQTRNFAVLHEVAKALQRLPGDPSAFDQVLALVCKVLRADRGYIVRGDSDDALATIAIHHAGAVDEHGPRQRLSGTVAQRVLRDRCGIVTSDAAADERFSAAHSVVLNDVRSILAVPMLVGERATGLIEVETSRIVNGFSEDDLDLLGIVASMTGAALDNLALAQAREATIGQLREAQAQLLAAQERLVRSEQMAAIGRIASGIAHEVKNHLSPFLLADMLRRQYPDDEDIQEATELMLEAQRRILGLVDEIRRFASGTGGELKMVDEDLSALAAGVVRFMRCDARIRAVDIAVAPAGPVWGRVDADRMRQVLINLLRNAADAVDARAGKVIVRTCQGGEKAWIEVEDNGGGIPEEVAARIFEPFFTTKGDRGLGLGLDISRSIVAAHGGSLTFRRREGGGTVFRVELPAAPSPEPVP